MLEDEETPFKLIMDNEKRLMAVKKELSMTYIVETDEGRARDEGTTVEGLPVDIIVQNVLRSTLVEVSVLSTGEEGGFELDGDRPCKRYEIKDSRIPDD